MIHKPYAYKVFSWLMVIGLWSHIIMGMAGWNWKVSTHGVEKKWETIVSITFWTGGFHLGNGEYDTTYYMPTLQYKLRRYNDQGSKSLAKLFDIVSRACSYSRMFSRPQDHPCSKDSQQDIRHTLAKTTPVFHRNFIFVGCSIPV